MKRLITGTGMI
uniref:Uncharacterized protein n=1 Tax=Arundo donax TaxID=35708 RepID=A0A0A9G238_ARUDO